MAEKPTRYQRTDYGFVYGAAEVTRAASHKGYVVLFIDTPLLRTEITVSPAGHSVKVHQYPRPTNV